MITQTTASQNKSRSLFHYTTSDGLLGIIRTDCLFASHYNFLNDTSEGNVVRDLLLPKLEAETRGFVPKLLKAGILKEELLAAKGDEYYRAEVGAMLRSMEGATNNTAPFFTTSFCVHEHDSESYHNGLLSQWRGYARGGFAIEFDENKLSDLVQKEREEFCYQGILTNTVHYRNFQEVVEPNRFSGLAGALFRSVLEEAMPQAKLKLVEILGDKTAEEFASPYLSIVPFLKNSGFEEEKEYRIVALCNRAGVRGEHDEREDKQFHFRSRPDGRIIPFIKLFERADELPIESVIVGPHPYQQNQIEALRFLLSENSVDCPVRASQIPFRE